MVTATQCYFSFCRAGWCPMHTPATHVQSFRFFAQAQTHLDRIHRSLHGSGSACLLACGWSGTPVPRPPRQVAKCPPDLPAAAASLRPAPSELGFFRFFTGPSIWRPGSLASRRSFAARRCGAAIRATRVSHRAHPSPAVNLCRLVFFHGPPVRCCSPGYPCTLRAPFLSGRLVRGGRASPIGLLAQRSDVFSSPCRAVPACAVPIPL